MSKNKPPRKMSHFTCIKTKIKERPYLIEALELMGHDIEENKALVINDQCFILFHIMAHQFQCFNQIRTFSNFRFDACEV